MMPPNASTPEPDFDFIDVLMDEVVAELANQPLPHGFQSRLAHRSQPMQLVSAAGATNVLQFQQLDRTGGRGMSPQSVTVAVLFNLAAILLIAFQVHAVRSVIRPPATIAYLAPVEAPKPMPRIVPPPAPPMPKPVAQVEPVAPKIKLPDVQMPEPRLATVQPMVKPMPMVEPAPPKVVMAASAPRPTTVNLAQSASVANQDAHPSAVALGHPDNPIHPMTSAAASAVNLGQRGVPGMPSTNFGGGPASAKVNLGSGQPGGSAGGNGTRNIAGVRLGITGGTGSGTGNGVGAGNGVGPAQVAMGAAPAPLPMAAAAMARTAIVSHAPQVLYKPTPTYTPEATALHIEGTVSVKIRVASNGVVTVLGVTKGLGHGLDANAVKAAQAIRFKPALDDAGKPTDWEGVVNILFQTS